MSIIVPALLRRLMLRMLTEIAGEPALSMTAKGQVFMSFWTSGSSNLRPISRLASKTKGGRGEWERSESNE